MHRYGTLFEFENCCRYSIFMLLFLMNISDAEVAGRVFGETLESVHRVRAHPVARKRKKR